MILTSKVPRLSEVEGLSEVEEQKVAENVADAVFAHPMATLHGRVV